MQGLSSIPVENGPDDTQHIWDESKKGRGMVLGAEVSLWNKAIDLSPEVHAPLRQGSDRVACGVIRHDKHHGETTYDVDVNTFVLSSEIQWPILAGHSNGIIGGDLHYKWASDALYEFVLNRDCQEQCLPNSEVLACKFCIEILVNQDACNLCATNQGWLGPIMRNLDRNPDTEGINTIELGLSYLRMC